MHDLFKKDSTLIHDIMGSENVRRINPHASVWEIKGAGDDYRKDIERLFNTVLDTSPRSILWFRDSDKNLKPILDYLEIIGPSLWSIHTHADQSRLFDFIKNFSWVIFHRPEIGNPERPLYQDNAERMIWMKYHSCPVMLEHDAWTGIWTVAAIENEDNYYSPAPTTNYLKSNFPVLNRLLGIWHSGDDIAHPDEVSWIRLLAQIASSNDRVAFIDEAKYFVEIYDIPLDEITAKSGRKINSAEEARQWVGKASNIFQQVEKNSRFEKDIVGVIQAVINQYYGDFIRKNIIIDIAGVWVRSTDPYESSARLQISFPEPDRRTNIEHHIQTLNIPLIEKGLVLPKGYVINRAREEIDYVLREAPFMKIYGMPRPVFAIPRHLIPLVVIIIGAPFLIWSGVEGLVLIGLIFAMLYLVYGLIRNHFD